MAKFYTTNVVIASCAAYALTYQDRSDRNSMKDFIENMLFPDATLCYHDRLIESVGQLFSGRVVRAEADGWDYVHDTRGLAHLGEACVALIVKPLQAQDINEWLSSIGCTPGKKHCIPCPKPSEISQALDAGVEVEICEIKAECVSGSRLALSFVNSNPLKAVVKDDSQLLETVNGISTFLKEQVASRLGVIDSIKNSVNEIPTLARAQSELEYDIKTHANTTEVQAGVLKQSLDQVQSTLNEVVASVRGEGDDSVPVSVGLKNVNVLCGRILSAVGDVHSQVLGDVNAGKITAKLPSEATELVQQLYGGLCATYARWVQEVDDVLKDRVKVNAQAKEQVDAVDELLLHLGDLKELVAAVRTASDLNDQLALVNASLSSRVAQLETALLISGFTTEELAKIKASADSVKSSVDKIKSKDMIVSTLGQLFNGAGTAAISALATPKKETWEEVV